MRSRNNIRGVYLVRLIFESERGRVASRPGAFNAINFAAERPRSASESAFNSGFSRLFSVFFLAKLGISVTTRLLRFDIFNVNGVLDSERMIFI